MDVILASASPRRKKLFSFLYDEFRVLPADIREIVPRSLPVEKCPEYLAYMKAESVAKGYAKSLVIGCDTTVIIDGKILNKPRSTADARMMMQLLSGKTHKVITGCCLFYLNRSFCFSEITEVEFYPLTEEEIEEYVITKEPYDDYYNVVGLPVARLKREIASFLSQDFSAEPTVKESKKKVRLKK